MATARACSGATARGQRGGDVAPVLNTEEDEVAVVDRHPQRAVANQDAAHDAGHVDVDEGALLEHRDARRAELGGIQPQVRVVRRQPGLDRGPGPILDRRVRGAHARIPAQGVSLAGSGDQGLAQDQRDEAGRARVVETDVVPCTQARQLLGCGRLDGGGELRELLLVLPHPGVRMVERLRHRRPVFGTDGRRYGKRAHTEQYASEDQCPGPWLVSWKSPHASVFGNRSNTGPMPVHSVESPESLGTRARKSIHLSDDLQSTFD